MYTCGLGAKPLGGGDEQEALISSDNMAKIDSLNGEREEGGRESVCVRGKR